MSLSHPTSLDLSLAEYEGIVTGLEMRDVSRVEGRLGGRSDARSHDCSRQGRVLHTVLPERQTASSAPEKDREGHLATIDWRNAQLVLRSPARITKDEDNAAFAHRTPISPSPD